MVMRWPTTSPRSAGDARQPRGTSATARPLSLQWSASLAPRQARRPEAALTGFRLTSEEHEIGELERGRTAAGIVVPPARRRGPRMRLPERAHLWSRRYG